ncbi:hypothetical protein [Massilia aerilata]|uniref:Lipoprotein n=1 Tax=Massilia aerilata TaxID=453817 RepID=A0ABW0RW55_9BURK
MPIHPARLLGATALALCALAACKREAPPPPKPAAVEAPAAPARTRDQAIAELMAVPELKAWSAQIEKDSRGKVHGAVIEDDPTPRVIEGKPYYQLSFVENRKQNVHRRASFLVAKTGEEILVEDAESDTLQSLAEWRRNIKRVELKSN